MGIAVHPSGDIYVADTNNDRIQVFDSDGAFISQFGSSGTGDSQFDYPFGIAVHPSGDIYVADYYNDRIQVFDSDGAFISQFGSSGTGDSQFNSPRGIAAHQNGDIYVVDTRNDRIQVFGLIPVLLVDNGNVGIGTTNPTQPLQVVGTIESTTGGFKFPDGTTQTTASMWTESGGEIYYDMGNVGIGNNDPNEILDVTGNILVRNPENNGAIIISPYDGGYGIKPELFIQSAETGVGADSRFHISRNAYFTTNDDQYYRIDTDDEASRIFFAHNGDIVFSNAPSGTDPISWTDILTIDAGTDYVGIGTTNPTQPLQVVGTIESTTGGFKFPDGTTQTTASMWTESGGEIYYDMGNVGIGNNDPNEILDVTGNILVRNPENNGAIIISPYDGGYGIKAELFIQSAETAAGDDSGFHISRNAYFTTDDNNYYRIDTDEMPSRILFNNNGDIRFSHAPSGTDAISWTEILSIDANTHSVGIRTTAPSQTLDVNGNAIADSWLTHSSQKWKKDIMPLDNTLDKVTQIQGVTYQWRADEFPERSFDDTVQIGFIAEELEMIYPELVYTTGNGDKSIDYSKLTPILLEAIKEQQNMINTQQEKFTEQQNMINTQQDILEQLKTVICPDNPELSACQ